MQTQASKFLGAVAFQNVNPLLQLIEDGKLSRGRRAERRSAFVYVAKDHRVDRVAVNIATRDRRDSPGRHRGPQPPLSSNVRDDPR
jgi:hypothetical protein